MPPAFEYRPHDKHTRQAASEELRARQSAHRTAWQYYEGQHRPQMRSYPDEPDDNTVLNLSRQVVDRIAAFLVPRFPTLELTTGADTQAEQWLRAAWESNGGARLLHKLVRHGAVDGHVFARVLPPNPHLVESDGPAYPRLVALNPANVVTFWQADDHEVVLWYEIYWAAQGVAYRQDIVRAPAHARQAGKPQWGIRQWKRPQDSAVWAEAGTSLWPHSLGPVVDWAHDTLPDRFYGVGELENGRLNDRVNRLTSEIARILRYHSAPRTVGIGIRGDDINATEIGNFWTVPSTDAKIYNLEMTGDLSASLNFLNLCVKNFFHERRVLVLEGELTDLRHITNMGIRALYLDQLSRTEELRRAYEIGLRALSRRLLQMGGYAAQNQLRIAWPDPLPLGDDESMSILAQERQLGLVSRETAAKTRGRDWPLEQTRMKREQKQAPSLATFTKN
jgi:hypothetical protein